MNAHSVQISERFLRALESVSPTAFEKQSKTRHIFRICDSIEKMVDGSLLRESLAAFLEKKKLPDSPTVVFMDRRGGGEGVRVSSGILELLSSKTQNAQYVHVSFMTPAGGVGTLLRSALVRKGAECGILVNVVAHKRPAEGLQLTSVEADELVDSCDLVVTFAPEGTAGLMFRGDEIQDELIARSHINILSFPDPEHVVADLQRYEEIIAARPGFNHIRFWVQLLDGEEFTTLGHCILGSGGDASDRLWVMLDNAKRHVYRVLAEPVARDVSCGDPLVYPCRRLLEQQRIHNMRIHRIVPAGSDIVLVGHKSV